MTYVQVYGYTPSVVYVGYTPGYYGTVVSSDNVVVYGTGYYYAPYIGPYGWVPAPYTYGVGAGFAWSATAGWALGFGMGMAYRVVVQSVVGPGWILGMGIWRSCVGMGRIWWRGGSQCLRTVGQHGV